MDQLYLTKFQSQSGNVPYFTLFRVYNRCFIEPIK